MPHSKKLSAIVSVGEYFYVVFDNLFSIGKSVVLPDRCCRYLCHHDRNRLATSSLHYCAVLFTLVGSPRPCQEKPALQLARKHVGWRAWQGLWLRGYLPRREVVNVLRCERGMHCTALVEQPTVLLLLPCLPSLQAVAGRHEGNYHALIEELDMPEPDRSVYQLPKRQKSRTFSPYHAHSTHSDSDYKVKGACMSEFTFDSENKGFEGAVGVEAHGEFYAIGLCEGNHCASGKKGRESGNGRLVVMKKEHDTTWPGNCVWKTQQMIEIPKSADFVDYSDFAIRGNKIAVTSQETSQLWMGEIDTSNPGKFTLSGDTLYDFPRDHDCHVQYCNIEGIHFLTDTLLAAVSDKMKSGGKQDFRCMDKDQVRRSHPFAPRDCFPSGPRVSCSGRLHSFTVYPRVRAALRAACRRALRRTSLSRVETMGRTVRWYHSQNKNLMTS